MTSYFLVHANYVFNIEFSFRFFPAEMTHFYA